MRVMNGLLIYEKLNMPEFYSELTMPENITARLWMTGEKGRQIYKVDARLLPK